MVFKILKKTWYYYAGGVAGGVAGYLYWKNVGCATGTCAITSSPVLSTIWGALIVGLLFVAIFSDSKKPDAADREKDNGGGLDNTDDLK